MDTRLPSSKTADAGWWNQMLRARQILRIFRRSLEWVWADESPAIGNRFFVETLLPSVDRAVRESLRGTSELLIAHDKYDLRINPGTYDEHKFVISVYERELLARIESWATTGNPRGHHIAFPAQPSLEFTADADVPENEIRVTSAPSVPFISEWVREDAGLVNRKLEAVRGPIAHAARPLDVIWEDEAGTHKSLTVPPTALDSPIIVGRDAPDPRYCVTSSLRTGRQQALLFVEDGRWYVTDGKSDGSPSRNATTFNGVPLPEGQRRELKPGDVLGFPDRSAAEWRIVSC